MLGSLPCAEIIAKVLGYLWSLIISEEGRLLFAALATTRAIIYYCGKNSIQDAQYLTGLCIVGWLLALLIASSEYKVAKHIREGLGCKGYAPMLPVKERFHKPD